jgi:dTDP-4-dehydrorhamnose reductase
MESWLITGSTGQLGGHLLAALARDPAPKRVMAHRHREGPPVHPAESTSVADLLDTAALTSMIDALRPTHIFHTAAMTAVSDCHADPAAARRANTDATRTIAAAAQVVGARLIFTSTDMVFAGDAAPYRETDPPNPLSEYGCTKAAAERELAAFPNTLTVRIPLLFGTPRNERRTTFAAQLAALQSGQPLKLFADEFRTPLWLPDAAAALVALARSDLAGVIHLAGPQRLSRLEMIEQVAAAREIDHPTIVPVSRLSVPSAEPRPADLSLDAARFLAQFPRLAPRSVRDAMQHERDSGR